MALTISTLKHFFGNMKNHHHSQIHHGVFINYRKFIAYIAMFLCILPIFDAKFGIIPGNAILTTRARPCDCSGHGEHVPGRKERKYITGFSPEAVE